MKKLLILASLLTLTACSATNAGDSFMDVYAIYQDHPIASEDWPENPTDIGGLIVDRCPPKPEGKCTSLLSVMQTNETEFYLKQTAGGPGEYFGPFTGDPKKIAEEAKEIDILNE